MPLRVIGIGDNVADHYAHNDTIYPGGCAYNFAMFAQMRGAEAAYLGIVGDDLAGSHILRTARGEGIDTSRCRIYHGEAPRPSVRIVDGGDRTFVGCNTRGVWERPVLLNERDFAYAAGFDLIHTSLFSFMEEHLAALADTGVPLSMDFSDEFTVTFFEAHCPDITFAELSCRHLSEADTEARIRQVHDFGSKYVIATRGEFGSFFSDGITLYHQPAHMVEARDTMGAGDSFLTAFLVSYRAWHLQAGENPTTDERRAAAETALEGASRFASRICMIDGSSGHGTHYPPAEH